ncbi:hypothetical protein DBR06_SOUSAS6610041, partial [Sousa chinensis]
MTNDMRNHRCHSTTGTPMTNTRKTHPLIKILNNTFTDLPTMKYGFLTRALPNPTNPNRPISSNTLHTRHNSCLLISNTSAETS